MNKKLDQKEAEEFEKIPVSNVIHLFVEKGYGKRLDRDLQKYPHGQARIKTNLGEVVVVHLI